MEIEMNVTDLIKSETARKDIYKGLSSCYTIPDAGLEGQLKELERHLAFLGSNAFAPAVLLRKELRYSENLEKMKVEFARLFIGPYWLAAPPYGSIYLEGKRKIMGDSSIDVRRRYLDCGLDISDDFKDAPDHIAAELEFMHYLVTREINAIFSEQADEGAECLYRQKEFLNDHLGAWIDAFSRNLEVASDCEFYLHLARATRVFIAEDWAYISNLNTNQISRQDYLAAR